MVNDTTAPNTLRFDSTAANSIKTKQDIIDLINTDHIQNIKVAITDHHGILRGKYMNSSKFLKAIQNGFGFCNVIAGLDIDDQLVPNLKGANWGNGYQDAPVEIITDSCRYNPFEPNTPLFLAQFASSHIALCPRQTLQRIVDRAATMGFNPQCALEYEFTVFQQSIDELYHDQFAALIPLTPANCGYSILRSLSHSEFYQQLLSLCHNMNIELESLHTEIGPGVLEAAIAYSDAMNAADKATLFKTITKAYAQRQGLTASFMAKWNPELQGQGGHIHLSLLDSKGNNVFYDAQHPTQMSTLMRYFIGGQQQLMPELLALIAPNVNSFSRLVPGYWSPTQASWGIDNRTCALRIIPGGTHSQRVEYRVAAADANPYLAIAVALASGLYGIEHQIEPTDPIKGTAYETTMSEALQLPRNLNEAAQRLSESKMAREWFGDEFIDDTVTLRQHEYTHAHDMDLQAQLRRYFELT